MGLNTFAGLSFCAQFVVSWPSKATVVSWGAQIYTFISWRNAQNCTRMIRALQEKGLGLYWFWEYFFLNLYLCVLKALHNKTMISQLLPAAVTSKIHKDKCCSLFFNNKKRICPYPLLPRDFLSLPAKPGRKSTHIHTHIFFLSWLSVGVRVLWGPKGALRGPSIKLSATLRIPAPHTDNPLLHRNKGTNNTSVAVHSTDKHIECMQRLENINTSVLVTFMNYALLYFNACKILECKKKEIKQSMYFTVLKYASAFSVLVLC